VTSHHLLFILMSAIWDVTWIATKAGLGAVPPLFFGAVRYILVSAVLVVAVVALILGALVYAEPLTWREATGAAIMLVAAAIAIAPRPATTAPG
jgi:drug/metabolite transporter (DMT)-like permease